MRGKNVYVLAILIFACLNLNAQTSGTSFKKYAIGNSGSFIYCPVDPGTFDVTKSDDESDVYTAEFIYNDYNWAIITVNFKEKLNSNKEENAQLLIDYLKFLEEQFGIIESAGYLDDLIHQGNPEATGVSDQWIDATDVHYSVFGWIDNNKLAVLLIYGATEYNDESKMDQFFNGFVF